LWHPYHDARSPIDFTPEPTGAAASKQVQSIKNLLWHGSVEEALERLADLILDLDLIRKHSASAEKLSAGLAEFETYIDNNQESIPNYGELYRQGETISTAFVESTINHLPAMVPAVPPSSAGRVNPRVAAALLG